MRILLTEGSLRLVGSFPLLSLRMNKADVFTVHGCVERETAESLDARGVK